MQPPKLDTRAEIQEKIVTRDSTYNTEQITWLKTGSMWVELYDKLPSRAEGVEAGVMETRVQQVRVRFRWRKDFDSTVRLRVNHPRPRVLQIVTNPADIGGRKAFMEVMAEEVSTDNGS